MLFKRKNGGIVEAKNNYEASILMSNKDYTPFENKEKCKKNAQKSKKNVQNEDNSTENMDKSTKSKAKDGE